MALPEAYALASIDFLVIGARRPPLLYKAVVVKEDLNVPQFLIIHLLTQVRRKILSYQT
jgi:hypothetical protein